MLESNFLNSTQSELIEPNSSLDKYSAPYNSSNQYAVSEHSLKAIYIFAKKIFFANCAVCLGNICSYACSAS